MTLNPGGWFMQWLNIYILLVKVAEVFLLGHVYILHTKNRWEEPLFQSNKLYPSPFLKHLKSQVTLTDRAKEKVKAKHLKSKQTKKQTNK